MEFFIYSFIFLVVYGISSIIWFMWALYHKHEKRDNLIDYIMYPIFLVIITIGTFISTIMGWNK